MCGVSLNILCLNKQKLIIFQVYTRSVIDPIPPTTDGDGVSKGSDKTKKKTKMTDDEIMEKLSKCLIFIGDRSSGVITCSNLRMLGV